MNLIIFQNPRLQVALSRSYKKFETIITIESFINDLANYFFGLSHKRAAHLQELAGSLKEKFYRYNKVFHIRWIVSEQQAVMKILKSYKFLLRDLEEISESTEFTLSSRNKAKEFTATLKSKNLVHALYFLADVLRIITSTSQELQQRENLIVDINRIMTRLSSAVGYAKEK